MNMRIKGTGSALPARIVTNNDLANIVETNDEWIKERTGIAQRHVSEGDTVSSLGYEAAIKALDNAGADASSVELILVATCSPEQLLPCAACQIQASLGASKAVAYDLNAACAGFLFALNSAYSFISSGLYQNALIIGSEVLSKYVDWTDRGTCILFGDGAGAVYVEATPEDSDYVFVQQSNGLKKDALYCNIASKNSPFADNKNISSENGNSGNFITMDGREIFKFAVSQVPQSIEEVLLKAGLSNSDIDYYLLHQANERIITSIAKRLKEDINKFPMTINKYGNMSSATIPVLLDELNRDGILKRGMKIVMSGFGAGLTYGATYLTW